MQNIYIQRLKTITKPTNRSVIFDEIVKNRHG